MDEWSGPAGSGPPPAVGPGGDPGPELTEVGGDPACWAYRVCPVCGRFNEAEHPTVCEACGASFPQFDE